MKLIITCKQMHKYGEEKACALKCCFFENTEHIDIPSKVGQTYSAVTLLNTKIRIRVPIS